MESSAHAPTNQSDEALLRDEPLLPLSTLQREIWLDQALLPDVPHYNTGACARIGGPVDVAVFRQALEIVVNRHGALRIVIVPGDELPKQRFEPHVSPEVTYLDFSVHPDADVRAREWIEQAAEKPFMLLGSLLHRFALLKVADDLFYWLEQYHHIIIDGWTETFLVQEVADRYNDLLAKRPISNPIIPSYVDFIDDERAYRASDQFQADEAYWKGIYQTIPEPLLTRRHDVAPADVYRAHQSKRYLEAGLCDEIRAFAVQHRVTLSQVFLAALYGYFARTGRRDDVAFGMFSKNRKKEFEQTAGLFVSTYSAWYRLNRNWTFLELLQGMSEEARRGAAHRRFPMSDLVRTIGLWAADRPRPFDVTVSFLFGRCMARFGSAPVELLTLSNGFHPHGLVIYVEDMNAPGPIHLLLDGNRTFFTQSELDRIPPRLEYFLASALRHPEMSISRLPLAADEELAHILAISSGPRITEQPSHCVHEWIAEQAKTNPRAIAVEFGTVKLTYAELNSRANRWAHQLQSLGVEPEVFVASFLERSPEMIIAMLAIWKSGGAYVPLDPETPPERLNSMLSQLRVPVVLTREHWREKLSQGAFTLIHVEDLDLGPASVPPSHPESNVCAENAAYAIFTSGSAGIPKGVVVTHGNLGHLARRLVDLLAVESTDRILQFTASNWDTSFEEVVPCLISGACLVLRTPEMIDPLVFLRECQAQRISIVDLPTAFFHELVPILTADTISFPESIRTVVIGGEAARANLVGEFKAIPRHPVRLLNTFGLTEVTAVSTFFDVREPVTHVPVGFPLPDVRAYVLDDHNEIMPLNVEGEMFIAGAGVARGYFGNAALTAERFVPDPHAPSPGARMYRTGDLAERREDGALYFQGRADQQVKIRGIRVELGEIEMALAKHPAVLESIVDMRRTVADRKHLVAYVRLRSSFTATSAELLQFARSSLPGYMVPEAVVFMDHWPRLPTGKIDRRGLPDPETPAIIRKEIPRTPIETIIAGAFADVLGVVEVGRHDDFFQLGGHSLLAMRLMSTLQSRLGFAPAMATVFRHSTVATLAAHIERENAAESILRPRARNENEPGFAGLSSTERRLWFLEKLHPNQNAYQAPHVLRISGPFDWEAFCSSLEALAQRHEILRTTYPEIEGTPMRRVSPEPAIPFRFVDPDVQTTSLQSLLGDELRLPFDLEQGPLTRVVCIRESADTHLVIVHQHHIITDEWSTTLLLRELQALYEGFCCRAVTALAPLAYQMSDFARAEQDAFEQNRFASSRSYWKEKLAALPRMSLPIAHGAGAGPRGAEGRVVRCIPGAIAGPFAHFARQNGCTLFMAWYAVFIALLSRYAQQTDFGVTSVMANRDVPGTESLLGFFTNTVILRTDLAGDPSIRELLARARKTAVEAYRHQSMPFDVVIQDQGAEWIDWKTPPVDVSFFEITSSETQGSASWTLEHQARFDLFPQALTTAKDTLGLAIEYGHESTMLAALFDSNRIDHASIERMLGHIETLAVDAMEHPDKRLSELSYVSRNELGQLRRFNETDAPYPADQCLHTLFESRARQTPDAPAVVFGAEVSTYAELDTRANRLASHLQSLYAKPETLIGLMIDRSADMIVAMLGILKAGAAYVPLDPALPEHRLHYLLHDTATNIVVTQTPYAPRLRAMAGELKIVCLDAELPAPNTPEYTAAPASPNHLAYVVYTSGSTGEPKGVMIEHQSVVAHVSGYVQFHRLTERDRVLALTPAHFDASVEQIFPALSIGGCVVIGDWDFEPESFSEKLIAFGITLLDTSGAHWRALVQTWVDKPRMAEQIALRTMIVGGDVMPAEVLAQWRRCDLSGRTRLVNVYGPTEATVAATAYEIPREFDAQWPRIPIGKPYANRRAFVLDQHWRPVPVGIPGELFLGGIGPARGYLHQAELTAEKFMYLEGLPDFAGRVYRTGDVCQWLADGSLDFLGRTDNQVKIRGYRVELGEIESHVRRLPQITDAVVVVHERGLHKSLVAYVVMNDGVTECDELALLAALRRVLPEHALPATFVAVSAIARSTTTGKVDRSKLPAPTRTTHTTRIAPRTPTETTLAEIFAALLKQNDVAIDDDFFNLGGHSLLAAQLVSRIERCFAIRMPLPVVFEHRSIRTLTTWIEMTKGVANSPHPGDFVRKVSRSEPLPPSFGQERLWFLDQMGKGAAFHVPLSMRIEGPLDVEALQQSLSEIVRRHESLRTTFVPDDGRLRQSIQDPHDFRLSVVDLRHLSMDARDFELERRLHEEARRPFDLATDCLLRATLLRLDDAETPAHVLVSTIHHIACDGWSLDVFVGELEDLYLSFATGQAAGLPEVTFQMADVAVWQREKLTADVLAPHITYWAKQLEEAPPLLQLPWDRPRSNAGGQRGVCPVRINAKLSMDLHTLAKQTHATMFMVLLAAFQASLARFANEWDIVVGTPVAHRDHEDLKKVIGFLVDNLCIRTKLADDPTYYELIHRVRQGTLEALEHRELPFERLVGTVRPGRDETYHPLFQVVFALHESSGRPIFLPGLRVTPLQTPEGPAHLDLEMHLDHNDTEIAGELYYDSGLFDAATIETFRDGFLATLTNIVQNPGARLSASSFATPAALRCLAQWNDTTASVPARACAHHLLVEQAAKTPDLTALLFDDGQSTQTLTYREWVALANRLGHYLQSLGVGPEKIVGLCLPPSLEVIIGLLGILVAGGAYLPLDPTYPSRRLEGMLQGSQVEVVVTHSTLHHLFSASGIRVVCLDRVGDILATMPDVDPMAAVYPDNLAYVMYTSGSTGRPKGVLVPHRGLVNVAEAQRNTFSFGPGDRVLQWAALHFDSSIAEIWMTLTTGATLCLSPREQVLPGDTLLQFMKRNRISMVTLTPSALAALPEAHLSDLHTLAVAGEACSPTLVEKWAPGRRFFNLYGPTEATIWSTVMSCENADDAALIGRPISNVQIYVLDRFGQLAPIGTPGELFIGGPGVTRGYMHQPGHTATRFLPNPFGPGLLYRTGDRARWNANGKIEFLGRTDHQVKLRGFRIEPGEIEAVLLRHPNVRQAVVVVREDKHRGPYLVAYMVLRMEHDGTPAELREHLGVHLPAFMIPAEWVIEEHLPHLPNGKVDRRALPQPEPRMNRARDEAQARTSTEEKLFEIWTDALGVAPRSPRDDFFALGGHSLLLAKVAARVQRLFQCDIPFSVLFSRSTIASQAAWIDDHRQVGLTSELRRVSRQGRLATSFVQERLWHLCQTRSDANAHNITVGWRLSGPLDIEALERALLEITRRHEALRTNIIEVDGEVSQVLRPVDFGLNLVDWRHVSPDEQERLLRGLAAGEAQHSFDLSSEPLFRATSVCLDGQTLHVLILNVHHIVADGTSMGTLVHELSEIYERYRVGLSSPLSDLPLQYADYAAWQRAWFSSPARENEWVYWQKKLAGAPTSSYVPAKPSRPARPSARAAGQTVMISSTTSAKLQEFAQWHNVSLFVVLLSAFKRVLARLSGNTDIVVATPVVQRRFVALEHVCGHFTNTLLLRTEVHPSQPFGEIVVRVQETLIEAFAHQDLPFGYLMSQLFPTRLPGEPAPFQLMFNMIPAAASDLRLLDITVTPLEEQTEEQGKIDLTMYASTVGSEIRIAALYKTDSFADAAITDMLDQYRNVLQDIGRYRDGNLA